MARHRKAATPVIYRFSRFQIDTATFELTVDGHVVPMPPKALDLLILLVSSSPALVTKQTILGTLWPGAAVTNNAIAQVLSQIRLVLDDDPSAPRYVQTVRGRGFRFIAEVADHSSSVTVYPPSPADGRRRTIAVSELRHLTQDPGLAWLSQGIAETISNQLRSLSSFSVIDLPKLADSARRGDLEEARKAGLDFLVVGAYQRSGDRLRITTRAIALATGEAIAHAMVDGAVGESFELQDRLGRQLLADLQASFSSEGR